MIDDEVMVEKLMKDDEVIVEKKVEEELLVGKNSD